MPFCRHCGKEILESDRFCPACGKNTAAAPAPETKANPFADTPEIEVDAKDAADNKWVALLGYFGILFLIPLLASPDSKFARFHANQGLVLFLACVVMEIASGIVGWIPVLGWLAALAINVALIALAIMGMVNAYNGKAKELPIIGKFQLIK